MSALKVIQVSYNCDSDLRDPEQLLARYETMVGWAEAIAAAGADVTVVQRFPASVQIVRRGVRYRFVPWPNADVITLDPADIVHVHGLIFTPYAWLLRRRLPARSALVLQNHGSLPSRGRGVRGWAQRVALGAADAFLFAAEEQGRPWRELGLIRPNQMVYGVVPASATLEPMGRGQARAVTQLSGDPSLLWVGRLNTNKDPLTVLEGFARFSASVPDATLTMAYGEATLLPALQARLASEPALAGRVRLIGAVAHDALGAFYSAADLFIVGSHYEGSGFSLIEALACGLVPVVTDIPSFRAIAGPVGRFWPAGDANACATALSVAVRERSPASRTQVRGYFERTLSWTAIGARAIEVYRDIVRRRTGTNRVLH